MTTHADRDNNPEQLRPDPRSPAATVNPADATSPAMTAPPADETASDEELAERAMSGSPHAPPGAQADYSDPTTDRSAPDYGGAPGNGGAPGYPGYPGYPGWPAYWPPPPERPHAGQSALIGRPRWLPVALVAAV